MVDVDRSGVAFSVDPTTQDPDRLVVEAAFGQGEVIVGGQVQPDTYVVDRSTTHALVDTHVGHQTFEIVRGASGTDRTRRSPAEPSRGARTRRRGSPRNRGAGRARRRATTAHRKTSSSRSTRRARSSSCRPARSPRSPDPAKPPHEPTAPSAHAIVTGLAAAPGVRHRRGAGAARSRRRRAVAARRDPGRADDQPRLVLDHSARAGAVVTDSGGTTCHAAIVSRELGVPAVVGAQNATTALTTGQLVTVDGSHGQVLEGDVERRRASSPATGRRRRCRAGRRRARRPSRPERCSTSTSPSPKRPSKRRGYPSTVSGCSAPSSCSPTRSTERTRAS